MIRHTLRAFVCSATRVVAATSVLASAAGAQGAIANLGFGYPVGGGSVRTNGTGGAFAEFDALTPTNPASLGGVARPVLRGNESMRSGTVER